MQVGVTLEETAVLVGWRKRSDNHVLVQMKAEAILYASEGVGIGIIAKIVERAGRAERTVQEWPADRRGTRMYWVLAGHAGNQDAAERPEGRTQGCSRPTALPVWCPRRVPRRPGPAVTS